MKRLLVAGASGLVGSEVMRAAGAWQTLGVARNRAGLASEVMDLTEPASIDATVRRFAPDAVVIASAWPYVDGCEKDPARSHRENVQTVQNLATAVPSHVRLVFFSTEHVFDGAADSYDELAATHPLSVYAKHKREVEELLLQRGNSLIARTSYVFGREARRKNFMYRVIEASSSRVPLKVPSAQAGMPTWAPWLALSALQLLDEGLSGVVHLTGPEVLTKAQWAALLAKGLALPDVEIEEVPWQDSGQLAPRPERVRLISTRHSLRHPPLLEILTAERASLLS